MFEGEPPPQQRRFSCLYCLAFSTLIFLVTLFGLEATTSGKATVDSFNAGVTTADSNDTIEVHLGNGCFWERQWAYYNVETDPSGPFRRSDENVSALTGYAGGTASVASGPVCYHTGDDRDYSLHGFAETVRVTLDAASAEAQLAALGRDFFDSFTGSTGHRVRPDPGDRGGAYRSVFGLPGGMASPLYGVFESENTFGMELKGGAGAADGDGDPSENAVYVYDTTTSPFYVAEVYHQFHCDFSMSAGMPYPSSYWQDLFDAMRLSGRVKPTGCPEDGLPHPGARCSAFGG